MKRALLFAVAIAIAMTITIACGGRIVGQDVGNSSNTSNNDGGDNNPFTSGGLTTGSCHVDVAFMPNGMPSKPVTHGDLVSTGKKVANGMELVCSGNAINTYHYVIDIASVVLQVGGHSSMATMKEQYGAGAHDNPQFANGSCTVTISSIDHDVVTGSIDCPVMWDDPLGSYAIKGTFDVPVP